LRPPPVPARTAAGDGKLHLHNRVEQTRYAIEQRFDQDT
jgi:hypothetical protein